MNIRPIWIIVDDGDLFEGHQGHWADCFFSNATRAIIQRALADGSISSETYTVRDMNDEELAKYPEIHDFCKELIQRYGEY